MLSVFRSARINACTGEVLRHGRFLLASALLVVLAGCGGGGGGGSRTSSTSTKPAPSTPVTGTSSLTPPSSQGATPSTPSSNGSAQSGSGQPAKSGSPSGSTTSPAPTSPPGSSDDPDNQPGDGGTPAPPATSPADPEPAPADVQIPAIPQVVVPEIVNISPAQRQLEVAMENLIDPVSGISVKSVTCKADGTLINDAGITSIDAEGNPVRAGSEDIFIADGKGGSIATYGGATITVDSAGRGRIDGDVGGNGDGVINIEASGAGAYNGRYGMLEISSEFGVSWSGLNGNISINGDGSGYWDGPLGNISIAADGSGSWTGGPYGDVINSGDGTGLVGYPAKQVKMAPMHKLLAIVQFPPVKKFAPGGVACGFVVTLSNVAVFDQDSVELRSSSKDLFDALAPALNNTPAKSIEVRGHTDPKSAADKDLSARRASAVLAALQARGAAAQATTKDFGMSSPIAPSDINGQVNPGGRQINQRTEVFVRL